MIELIPYLVVLTVFVNGVVCVWPLAHWQEKKKEVFCQIQSIHWPKCLSALKMFKLAVLILMVDNSCNS